MSVLNRTQSGFAQDHIRYVLHSPVERLIPVPVRSSSSTLSTSGLPQSMQVFTSSLTVPPFA
jgi:hypothetical protein